MATIPRANLSELISSDVWRCRGKHSLAQGVAAWFTDPAFRPVFTLRLSQAISAKGHLWAKPLLLLLRLWHRRTQWRCGVDLPWNLRLGHGFKLLHGWGIVINRDTIIGDNVTVMQGVTIGGTRDGAPTIEDDVIVCANATVIGKVTLGKGCVVGAGCVVTKDVAANTTVVGNPQRVIPRRQSPKGYNSLPGHECVLG